MSNMYNQFNIRGPRNSASRQPNTNVHVRNVLRQSNPLLSLQLSTPACGNPTLVNAPMAAPSGTVSHFPTGSQPFVVNCNSVQSLPPYQPINLQHQSAFGMCATAPASNLPHQVLGQPAAVMLASGIPVPVVGLPAAAPMQPMGQSNVPQASVLGSILSPSVTPSAAVGMPFRPVRWIPPTASHTGVPDMPYAVEIKPEVDEEVLQKLATTSSELASGTDQPEATPGPPAVYLDIAMDSNSPSLKSEAGDIVQPASNEPAENVSKKAVSKTVGKSVSGKRKAAQSENTDNVPKAMRLRTRPCAVSLTRLYPAAAHSESDSSEGVLSELDDDYNPSDDELSESDAETTSHPAHSSEADSKIENFVGTSVETVVLAAPDDETVSESVPLAAAVVETVSEIVHVPAAVPQTHADSDQLIASDEDIESDDPAIEQDASLPDDDASKEKSVCYEVLPENSEMLFEMECDGKGNGDEVLRVLIPSAKAKSTRVSPNQADTTTQVTRSLRSTSNPVECSGQNLTVISFMQSTPSVTVVPAVSSPVTSAGSTHPRGLPTVRSLLSSLVSKTYPSSGRVVDVSQASVSVSVTLEDNAAGRTSSSVTDEVAVVESGTSLLPASVEEMTVQSATASETVPDSTRAASQESVSSSSTCEGNTASPASAAASDNSDDIAIIESDTSAGPARNQNAASQQPPSWKDSTSLKISQNKNCLLDVPVQSSFFRFEAQSPEVFRLLSLERSRVPGEVLRALTKLVGSADESLPDGEKSRGSLGGDRRTLMYQCLFCPYGEMSAKRIVAHIKLRHGRFTSFLHSRLLPSSRIPLMIFCRHCNFITYDAAVLWIHFATFHKVCDILVQPKLVSYDVNLVPLLNPKQRAVKFPFYSCPNCNYVDSMRPRIIDHIVTSHASAAVFLGCVARLVLVRRSSKYPYTVSYERFAKDERYKDVRKEIYTCVSCGFFSFYPTYALCHHVASHHHLELLYVCAATPLCAKQCTSLEDVLTHVQTVHMGRARGQLQCMATVVDCRTAAQLLVEPGSLSSVDIPQRLSQRTPSANASVADVEIVLDDDEDDDVDGKDKEKENVGDNDVVVLGKDAGKVSEDDVVVLSPATADSDDVEPDSLSTEQPDVQPDTSRSCETSLSFLPGEQNLSDHGSNELHGSTQECSVTENFAGDISAEAPSDSYSQNTVEGKVLNGSTPSETDLLHAGENSSESESVREPDAETDRNCHDVDSHLDDTLNGQSDGLPGQNELGHEQNCTADVEGIVQGKGFSKEDSTSAQNESLLSSNEEQTGSGLLQENDVEPNMTPDEMTCEHSSGDLIQERSDEAGRNRQTEAKTSSDETGQEPSTVELTSEHSSNNLVKETGRNQHIEDDTSHGKTDQESSTVESNPAQRSETASISAEREFIDLAELPSTGAISPVNTCPLPSDLANRDSIAVDKTAASLTFHQTDEPLSQQQVDSCAVMDENDGSNPLFTDDITTELDLFDIDSLLAENIGLSPEGFGFSDDVLSGFENSVGTGGVDQDGLTDVEDLMPLSDRLAARQNRQHSASLSPAKHSTTLPSTQSGAQSVFGQQNFSSNSRVAGIISSGQDVHDREVIDSEQSRTSMSSCAAETVSVSTSSWSKTGTDCETMTSGRSSITETDSGSLQGNVCSPTPVDRSRFKTLASFRFSSPHSRPN